jgi:branched-chain amino acid transport system ATP-binding protein
MLAAEALDAGYHGHPIVRGLNLRVEAGEICALLGANGAGKTTTLLTLAGELPALRGTVALCGEATRAPLHRRVRSGLAFVTEERSVFMGMSVADNLRVGDADLPRVLALFPELEPLLPRRAGLLSGGEQQMLTLARALARRPRVLLVDELSLGLAPLVVERLLNALAEAANRDGVAVLLVEQHTRQAMRIAHRVLVMRRGEIVLEGTGSDLRNRPDEVEAAYLEG